MDMQKYYKGMIVLYKDIKYKIMAVDLEEELLGLLIKDNEEATDTELTWVRKENCFLITCKNCKGFPCMMKMPINMADTCDRFTPVYCL